MFALHQAAGGGGGGGVTAAAAGYGPDPHFKICTSIASAADGSLSPQTRARLEG